MYAVILVLKCALTGCTMQWFANLVDSLIYSSAFDNTEQSSTEQWNYSHSNFLSLVETNKHSAASELKEKIMQNSPTAVYDW